jgi:hypothetical protein
LFVKSREVSAGFVINMLAVAFAPISAHPLLARLNAVYRVFTLSTWQGRFA